MVFSNIQQKVVSLKNFNLRHKSSLLILLILFVSIIGTVVLAKSTQILTQHASALDSARFEAESAALSGPITTASDTTASNGQYITLNDSTISASGPTAMPVISRGVPAFTNDTCGGSYPATNGNDANYNSVWWGGCVNASATLSPSVWLAYDLSSVPASKRAKIVIVWYTACCSYNNAISGTGAYNIPGSYTIEANSAAGGTAAAPTSGWVILATVTGNTYHSRQHLLNFNGYNWIRINITQSDGSVQNYGASINMDVHDASAGVNDDFIFYGDSITEGSMGHDTLNGVVSLPQLINAQQPANFPVEENGGIGYQTTASALTYIDAQLAMFPGHYVGLAYGTNDANGNVDSATFYSNYASLIQKVIAAGKVPIVPTIPWGCTNAISTNAPILNQQIQKLYTDFPQIVHGPDLYNYFKNNQSLISSDCIHPSTPNGMGAYRQQWANALLSTVYAGKLAMNTKKNMIAYVSENRRHSVLGATTTLPGQQVWNNGVSSFLFGTNDTEEWGDNNVETDPNKIIQPTMKNAHMQLNRTFVFHYSLRDGHRTTIGNNPQANSLSQLNNTNAHEFDQPTPPSGLLTPTANGGYEVENRIKTGENMGTQCLVVFRDITTDAVTNNDPDTMHKRITDPDTGQLETDLDFAKKVVAYLGNRCNMYEIGNEPDLDAYEDNGYVFKHMDIKTYVERWTEFVTALRQINPNAKFIGPVVYNPQGNDCTYTAGTPYPSSQPGDCYMRNFLHAVKGTSVEPDAISFHLYGDDNCGTTTPGPNCLTNAHGVYSSWITQVRQWIQSDLGHNVPMGITEWNANPAEPQYMVTDPTFANQWTNSVMQAMINGGLDFANQFDAQSDGGYCYLDMFNSCNGTDQPTGMFTAMQALINQYMPNGNVTPTPTAGSITATSIPTVTAANTNTPTPTAIQCAITVPSGTGIATLSNITLPSSGTYNIFTRMQVPVSGNSYYLQIDNNCPMQITDATSNSWDWIPATTPFSYQSGTTHTITLYGNNVNVKIDSLIFSQSCTPTGTGDNCIGSLPSPTTSPTPTITITPTSKPVNTPTITPTIKITATPTPTIPVATPTTGQTGSGTLTYVGSTNVNGVFSGAGLTITMPNNIHSGQLLIAAAGTNGPIATWQTPAGWNAGNGSATVSTQGLHWWWKIANGSESGTKLILKSSKYADGGAIVAVYNGATATPIAGVSILSTSDNNGTGNVKTAKVNSVSINNTTVVPLILASWQPSASQITWPANFIFEASATDGYASISLAEQLNAQTTSTIPAQVLNFTQQQAVIQTLQIGINVQ